MTCALLAASACSSTSFDTALPGNVWTNNTFDDGTVLEASN